LHFEKIEKANFEITKSHFYKVPKVDETRRFQTMGQVDWIQRLFAPYHDDPHPAVAVGFIGELHEVRLFCVGGALDVTVD
jgi:hypothetical protein